MLRDVGGQTKAGAATPAQTKLAGRSVALDELKSTLTDTRCEEALVGAALYSEDAARLLAETPVESFTDDRYSSIAEAVVDLAGHGLPVDEVTVSGWLRDHDRWDAVGGHFTLTDLSTNLPDASRAAVYRARVLDMFARRLVVEAAVAGDWDRLSKIAARAAEVVA